MFFGGGGFPFEDMGGGGRGPKKAPVDSDKFYKALEVDKSANAAEIKKAYRKLAIKHHPDKGGDPEKFKEITKAYEVLSDDEKRRTYDQYGEEGLEGNVGGGDPTDIFEMMFGGGGRPGAGGKAQKKKGKNVVHPMPVSLEQMFKGHTKKLAINRTVIDEKIGVKECSKCNGRGFVVQVVRMGNMIQQVQQQCENCNGTGQFYKTKKEKEILEVFIERGAPDGHKVTFYNKADEQPGYEAGDVQFLLQQKEHAEFKRTNADLTISRKITLLEALTGVQMEITHLDGRKLLIKTKPGEVVTPPESNNVDWVCFDDLDLPGENVAQAKCSMNEVDKLKDVCVKKGFSGFCLDTNENQAVFKELSREDMMTKAAMISEAKKNPNKKKGVKTFIVPDPELEKMFRMRKAVKGEGMPLFKNPMLRGNLFVEFTIDFPKSVSEDAARALRQVLPGPDPNRTPDPMDDDDELEHLFLEDMDPKTSAKEASHAYEEDDDDAKQGGAPQGVQCAQQ